MRCAEPVSWLRLESYHLGELSEPECRAVENHLQECALCRKCSHVIETDRTSLPPLPETRSVEKTTAVLDRARERWWALFGGVGLAVAAAATLLWVARPAIEDVVPGPLVQTKGGEVSLTIVRERNGQVSFDSKRFVPGDRFKVLMTCPPRLSGRWDLVVFQADGASFPLSPWSDLECGNRVPWPGAFRLTEATATQVCVVWGSGAASLRSGSVRSPAELKRSAVCRELEPAK